ncbi:FIP1[V]-like protein [Carya illinoinensis]|uniref:Pre-mRNA polyadenylation factor Fip1 domain-containing protein n=1 Tax=Carya illinoinensis TaxID=32201 RepID=A0A8T1NE11_CARIL|nr:FIP1[V]-like protein [Carya illinoinensis]KAG6628061.1 hypothetical protein CIPAW_15G174200 [Carya illinoinensis]KAG6676565.1 hypothetical protein I3842_15G158200 [Carya illinoinensis]
MEDDDEFGDLYTDVLRPFASTPTASSAAQDSLLASHAPPSLNRPTGSDDEEIVYGAPRLNSAVPNLHSDLNLAPRAVEPTRDLTPVAVVNSSQNLIAGDVREEDLAAESRVLDKGGVELPIRNPLEDVNYGGDRTEDLIEQDVKFDIEEATAGIYDASSDPIIPGLSGPTEANLEASRREDVGGENDWDSDSEDDLQIVLNDNNHGHMAMERGGIGGEDDDDDDEDGDPLVIVADGELNQDAEAPEWGDDAAQAAAQDGERKETGEGGKVSGGVGATMAPKIGYSNHGYHPFHSQFKYVRPGAAPMLGTATSAPGGVPGQVRPLVNMGPMPGRGRGDWRPTGMKNALPMQKGFHSGFGLPAWGNNMAGRGFGGGLDFTLPSHKTIFDVDIDNFEEKPWKYPGVDTSDFFNFGLNEESWKDYCKQLEPIRLESTMQSKIRVYESGRTEQDYDPDLPPELAAATGVHDVSAENANLGKLNVTQNDLAKGSARVRPPIPTGRAIQVEGGYGGRLPSIDTRPPRIRDSDAIIEIVLQDSLDDDSSTGNGVIEQPVNDPSREDRGGDVAEEHGVQVDSEDYDGLPQVYNGRKRDQVDRKKIPLMNSVRDNLPKGERVLSFLPEAPVQHSGSRGQTSAYPSENLGTPYDERPTQGREHDQSPHMTPSRSTRDGKFQDNKKEESVDSMDGKHSLQLSSPDTVRDSRELSIEPKDVGHDERMLADGSPEMEKDEMTNSIGTDDSLKDGVVKKLSSRVEQPLLPEFDEGDYSKAARSSENSKTRSGSSRDYQKWRDGAEEEVIQGRSARVGTVKRHPDENEPGHRRKNRDGRQEIERNPMAVKGIGEYSYRDWDSSSGHQLHMKTDGFNRRKEKDNLDGPWSRRDDDPYIRRIRNEDTRKRERGDEMGSRQRSKVRDGERSDKDEYLHSRKQLDNGSYRVQYDKDAGSRHRERDDGLKSKYGNVDDYHSKRRKDEEYLKRDRGNKEEILHGHRESTPRRKRERDDVLDPRKRDDQLRLRDNLDDHHSVRHKDEIWLQRERGERQRERDEWHRLKQTHEDYLPKRERDEGRVAVRGGRGPEDKSLVSHARAKEDYKGFDKEYQFKDTARHSEQSKRKDRIEDESSHHRGRDDVYPRGNQFNSDERRSRLDRSSSRNDRAVNASDNQRLHDKKHKENTRKLKDSDSQDHNAVGSSKRNQEDHSGQINEAGLKGSSYPGNGQHEIPANRRVSRKHREDASSEDEQHDSKRGRSKLERWTSHTERDYSINSRSSSSLKLKEIDRKNNGASFEASKPPDESAKMVEAADSQQPLAEEKDASDLESKDVDTKPLEDRHLDTVEKLKKRSERFKLPMPSEKEALTIKKMESEALPSSKSEAPADAEIKPERPPRKRRWISN